jgi:general secretion pathway protein C
VRLVGARQALERGARALPMLVLVSLIVLGGWLAARWVVYFASPAETPVLLPLEPLQLDAIARAVADGHVFGIAETGGAAVTSLNVKLKGVFATSDSGVAILNTGGRDEPRRVGAELAPGIVLESLHARHVVLNRNGAREHVNLEERASGAAIVASARPGTAPRVPQASVPSPLGSPPTGATPVPPMRPGPSAGFQFQRPEPYAPVGDVATEPQPAPQPAVGTLLPQPAIGAPPPQPAVAAPPSELITSGSSQGLVIQAIPQGSMLERLGLQPGDVVRSVNGEPVTSESDVARILQQRGIQGSFSAEVQRGGITIPLAVGGQQR